MKKITCARIFEVSLSLVFGSIFLIMNLAACTVAVSAALKII